jgi:hypothetical protein
MKQSMTIKEFMNYREEDLPLATEEAMQSLEVMKAGLVLVPLALVRIALLVFVGVN